jgi:hypothetical protein
MTAPAHGRPPEQLRRVARTLRDLVEPIAGCVYFLPEVQAEYEALGFGPRSGMSPATSYFCSRGACLGQVPGAVVASSFGVFKPSLVQPLVDQGWTIAPAAALLSAREKGTVTGLSRILGPVPSGVERATELLTRAGAAGQVSGRALYAGLRSLGFPGTPLGDLWRAADLVREHRGDSHIAAWTSHGLDAVEAQLLQELWWQRPMGPYTKTRGWTDDEIEAGKQRLRARGLISGDELTIDGEVLRGGVEDATDRQEARIVDALGDDADELFALLEPWAVAIVEAKGYPVDPRQMTRYG